MSVLLLNASFEPLRVISTRRAFGLLIAGKAEVLEEGDGQIQSAHKTHTVPLVLRLKYMVRVPFQARVPLNRHTLTVRDSGACQVSGCPKKGTTMDHLLPRSRGGRHTWDNVVLMCHRHNRVKSDNLLSELGWTLKQYPRAPRQQWMVLVAAQTAPQAAWEPYLGLLRGGVALA